MPEGNVPWLVMRSLATDAHQSLEVRLSGGVKGRRKRGIHVRLLHVKIDIGIIEQGRRARVTGLANPDAHQRRAGELGVSDAEVDDPKEEPQPRGAFPRGGDADSGALGRLRLRRIGPWPTPTSCAWLRVGLLTLLPLRYPSRSAGLPASAL